MILLYYLLSETVNNALILESLSYPVAFLLSCNYHLFSLLELMSHYGVNVCLLQYCISRFLLQRVKSVKAEDELNILTLLSELRLLVRYMVLDSLPINFFHHHHRHSHHHHLIMIMISSYLTFVECSGPVRNQFKHFTFIKSFNLHKNHIKQVIVSSIIHVDMWKERSFSPFV